MKLEPDLIKKILIAYEALPYRDPMPIQISGYTEDQLNYHQELLIDAGFLMAEIERYITGRINISPKGLTLDAHKFLDAHRDDTHWEKVKSRMLMFGGSVMEVARPLLVAFLKDLLHLD